MTARRLMVALPLLLGGALACKDKTPTESPFASYQLAIQGGDGQSGPAGSVLDQPLQAIVKDAAGNPVRAVPVIFRVVAGSGASLSDTIATTGIDGVARVDVRVGPTTAPQAPIVLALIRGGASSQQVTFNAAVTAGPTLTNSDRSSVSAGDTVTLTGTNFNTTTVGNSVLFGTAHALVLQGATTTTLRVVVPPCVAAGTVPVRVQVGSATTNPLNVTYVASSPSLDIALYDGLAVAGTELGNCLTLPGNGIEYLLVPQYATGSAPLSAVGYQIGDVQSPLAQVVARTPSAVPPLSGVNEKQVRFDLALRTAEGALAPAAAALGGGARERRPETLSALTVGSTRSFRVLASLDPSNPSFKTANATLKFVGPNVLLYVDNAAPSGGFSDAQLQAFGHHFDQDLYPIDERVFGPESDIDGNGHIIVLMSPIVNGLTDRNECVTSGFVTGFFYGFDLASTSSNSNKGEVFYSIVPDPTGTQSCAHSTTQVGRIVPSTFIHEFQHMISYNQHVLVRGGSQETVWLNEGLSHMAEEMGARYYENKYPPGTPQHPDSLMFPDTAFDFIAGDLVDSYSYLLKIANNSVTTFSELGSLEERGAAWLFLRWLADQRDSTIFARLVQTRKTSIENIEDKTGETFAGLFGDFGIALYTDSIPGVPRTAVPKRFRFTSRNFRAIYDRLYRANAGSSLFPKPFPIDVRSLPFNGASIASSMVPGTMEFYRLTTPTGGGGTALRFSAAGGGTFSTELKAQVGIFRLK